MIKIECIEVSNTINAIRGMRNPMNSWSKMDSEYKNGRLVIGKNDLSLMKKLCRAGEPHRKFLRQIFVSMDITAPLYWYKEFDTYKVGTVSDSCSTMHRIHEKEFIPTHFSTEHLDPTSLKILTECIIPALNINRDKFLSTNLKTYWWQMIQLLPSSYNQKRTVTMNYETVFNIVKYRLGHKLDEWNEFIAIMFKELPYFKELYYAVTDETLDADVINM